VRTEKGWVAKAAAVTADGDKVTATTELTPIDANSFTWRSLDRTVGGEKLPDVGPFKVVREGPAKAQSIRKAPAPPYSGERGWGWVGVRGSSGRDKAPLTPDPSPRSTGARGVPGRREAGPTQRKHTMRYQLLVPLAVSALLLPGKAPAQFSQGYQYNRAA